MTFAAAPGNSGNQGHIGRRIAGFAALVTFSIGLAAILGWLIGIPQLASGLPGLPLMKFNAAVLLVASAAGLALCALPARSHGRIISALGLFVCVVAGANLLEHVSGVDLGIDQLVVSRSPLLVDPNPGRMMVQIAIAFLPAGAGLLALGRSWRGFYLTEILGLACSTMAGLVVVGYLYELSSLNGLETRSPVALTGAVALTSFGVGLVAARSEHGLPRLLGDPGAAGQVARRVLPTAVVVIPFAGWLTRLAENASLVDSGQRDALAALLDIVVLLAVGTWATNRALRVEETLRESEALLRAFFESPGAMRSIVELVDDRIVSIADNAEAIAFFDLVREPVSDGSVTEGRTPTEILQLYRNHYEESRRTRQPVQFEYERPTPQGVRWIQALVSYVGTTRNGRDRFASTVLDITARVEAQAELARAIAARQASLSLMTAILDGTTDHINVKDPDGRHLFINRVAAEWFGLPVEDIIGRTDVELASVEEAAELMRLDRDIIETGRPRGFEKQATHDGVPSSWWIVKDVARDPNGATIGLFTIAREITEQKRTEAHFRQVAKMEAVGQMAGGVAHDFNNLLTAIRGYAQLVLANLDPGLEQDRADLAEIVRAADRASALTQQLLAFSRRQVQQLTVVDLAPIVDGLAPMLRHVLGEQINLAIHTAAGAGHVRVDPSQLEQVVVNLVLNARDAMPDGGDLTIETRTVELDARFVAEHPGSDPGPHVLLAVSDSGIGMGDAIRTHIFEPFFTTKQHGQGTGLGLSTVYGIVKQSGGAIYVDSELGRGTTFRVYLPRVIDVPADAPAERVPARASLRGSETILLVEDQPAVRRFAQRALEEQGYRVLEAAGGAEALAIAAAHEGPIALLLTDVVMPGMQGDQLAQQMQAVLPGLPVLYVSGFTENSVIHHGLSDEGVNFLPKPYSSEALSGAVRRVLDGRHSPAERPAQRQERLR